MRHGVKRKTSAKRLEHTENLASIFNKAIRHACPFSVNKWLVKAVNVV